MTACLRRHRRDARAPRAAYDTQLGRHHHGRDHADRVHAAIRLRVRRVIQARTGNYVDLANLLQWPADLSIQSMSAEGKATTSRYLQAEIDRAIDRGLTETAEQITMIVSFMNVSSSDVVG